MKLPVRDIKHVLTSDIDITERFNVLELDELIVNPSLRDEMP